MPACIRFFLFLFSLLFPFLGLSQVELSGRLIDSATVQPVPFAQIALMSADSSIITGGQSDMDGNFKLSAESGDYLLKAVFIGYEDYYQAVEVKNEDIDLGILKLTPTSQQLNEVVIEADLVRKPIEADLEGIKINPDQTLSNAGGSVIDVLRNTPSVSVSEDGSVSIRGSSGTNVLIDGRNSALGSDLEQIPASAVKSIKIITNPNSKYDAQAAGGIINIQLKKGEDKGAGGSAEVTGGTRNRFNGALRGNMKKENFSLYGGYSFRHWPSVGTRWTERTIYADDEFLRQDETTDRKDIEHTINIGGDYFFGKNKISYEGAFNAEEELSTETVRARIFELSSGSETLRYSRQNEEREENYTFDNALIYERLFDDSTKEFRAVFSHSLRDNIETQDIDAYRGDLSPESGTPTGREEATNDELRQTFVAQIDYAQSALGGTLETGYKTTARAFDNDYVYEIRDPETGIFVNQTDITNRFLYEEAVHAGYVMLSRNLGKLSINGGVRAEWTLIETKLFQRNEINNQNYIDFFPSFQSLYQIDKKNAIKFTYSRRIDRPGGWRLNPFPDVTDTLTIRSGNPNLQPEYINSFEVGHLINWETASLSYNLFYRYTTGLLDYLVRVEDGISYRRPENLNTGETYGAEVIATAQPIEWWSVNGSVSLFQTEVDGSNIEGGRSNSGFAWNAKVTSDFDLPWDLDMQVTANYTAPDIEAQGRDFARYYADVSFQRDFLDNRMSASLIFRDVLDTRNFAGENFTDDFDVEFERKRETRIILLSLRYKI
ncbi:MAG TPA: TonB-dependent receptor [Cryomorphaceae bacterium]|nr:TonB-dependent receptor [Cryomorphaceae bacterium]